MVSAPNHTPGPWAYSPPDDQVQDLFTEECFFIEGPGSDVHGHMTLADAKLIAAAPELLAALQEMIDGDAQAIEEAKLMGVPFPAEMLSTYEKARAALAKATKGSP